MKKKIFIALSIITLSIPGYSQVETIYFPQESIYTYMGISEKDCDFSKVIQISHSENNSFLKNDTTNREKKRCQSGKSYKVQYSLEDGSWKNTNGGRIWTLTIESKGASSIGFSFNKFRLPNGARLYISNHDGSVLYGPVTKDAIAEQKKFTTNIIHGEQVSIFLFEPNSQKGKSELEISKLYHGTINIAPGTKDNCRIHVPCVSGWDLEADATGSIKGEDDDYYYFGSGALVMTTNCSYKGYFLTAKHVIDNCENFTVTFFKRLTTCDGNETYSTITCNNVVLRASWANTDMALMEILDLPTNNGRIAWLGWDRTGMNSNNNATIHYPYDDTANISIDYDNLSTYNTHYWLTTLDMGIMAGGSSGAPLLNQNRRIIGQERGCIGNTPTECDQINSIFGKFSLSWTGGGTDDTRLSNWLDPNNTGITIQPSSFDMNLSGQTYICNSSTATYTINNLPSVCSVNWYLSDGFGPTAPTLQSSGSTCTITNNLTSSYMGKLHADIYYQGTLQKSCQQQIVAYGGFYGLVTTTNQQFSPSSPVWVAPGSIVALKSPNLVQKNVSYSVVNPSAWQYYASEGGLTVGYPSGSSAYQPIVISIQNNTLLSDCDNSYQILIMPTTVLPHYQMQAGGDNGNIMVELTTETDEEAKKVIQAYSIPIEIEQNPTWTLEVFDAASGTKLITKNVTGTSAVVATGKSRGVFVVRATIGKEVLSEKVVLR